MVMPIKIDYSTAKRSKLKSVVKKNDLSAVNLATIPVLNFSSSLKRLFHRLSRYSLLIARLSKAKSTTHDFAQAIMKKLFKQKINYPISYCVVSAAGTVCRGFCLTSLITHAARRINPVLCCVFSWCFFGLKIRG